MSEFGNTEKLIELVRERSLLYDLSNIDYKNRDKKAEAWLEIATEMGFGESKYNSFVIIIIFQSLMSV